ncbi:LacI family transcriptional regulator [Clostridia bacterium]|nr:LacI family transcriptional regulator [Clostridia bacterium]
MKNGKITIYDIAGEAQVSTATVSRVLAKHPGVSAKTQARVSRVIEKYHFKPSTVARGLYQQTSHMLGILLPGVLSPYYAALYAAAYDAARASGYALLTFHTSPSDSISMAAIGELIERRLDGALLLGGIVEAVHPQDSLAELLGVLQRHMPIVTICPPIAGVDCVNFHSDLSYSVRQSVRHLHALGHQRIAFLGGSLESRSAGEREMGFRDEMSRVGLSAEYRHEAGHTPEAGEMGVLRMLTPLSPKTRPTALIAINDLVALGAMRQLKRMGLRIPEDIAIIGCDNQFFSPYTDPPLTTVDLHPGDLGRIAVQQLIATLTEDRDNLFFSQVKEATLVIRESCGARLGRRAL